MSLPMRTLFGLVSPRGARARLSTLIFHRVLPAPDAIFPEEMDAARFDAVCGWLARDFNVLPLDEAVVRLREGRLPARACCITFDDGYADNLHVAVPILQRHGLSATFFVATGFLDGGRMWNDTVIETLRACAPTGLDLRELGLGRHDTADAGARRCAIDAVIGAIKYLAPDERLARTRAIAAAAGVVPPDDLMLTTRELRRLRGAGMLIGAHTVDHPILATLPAAQARVEIDAGRRTLEDALGERVGLFAYPNGKPHTDYLPEHVAMVRELGFDAAVSTAWGVSTAATDPYQLRRFTPWDRTRLRFEARLLRNML